MAISTAITEPTAAVIIPHYNDTVRLGRCLAALAPQLDAAGPAVEVVVADNGSTEDLSALKAAHPGLRFLTEPTKGAAAARNAGVAATRAPWIFFLDADCIPDPDWLATALALGGTDEMIGGRIEIFDETPPPRSGAEAFETVFGFAQKDYVERKRFSVTANLLTTRRVFEATGPFRPLLAEDLDWCHRAGAAGYAIRYAPELAVSHPSRSDWTALERKWRRITSEGFHVNGTGLGARLKWAVRAGAVLASGIAHLPRVMTHPALNGLERRRAAATLLALRTRRCLWMLREAATGEG